MAKSGKRPLPITTLSIIFFILFIPLLFMLRFILPLCGIANCSWSEIVVFVLTPTLLLVSPIGLWKMRVWGLYTTIGLSIPAMLVIAPDFLKTIKTNLAPVLVILLFSVIIAYLISIRKKFH